MSDGLIIITPTSIASTGTGNSSSIGANGKVTFSTCATLSLNGVFTSTYDSYLVSLRVVSTLNNNGLYFRLRASGTDASGANYTQQFIVANGTSLSAARASSTDGMRCSNMDTIQTGDTIVLFGPFLSQPTAVMNFGVGGLNNCSVVDFVNTHSLSTSYDGLTFYLGGGTFTGAMTVYGFKQ